MNGIILLAIDCSNRWTSLGLSVSGRVTGVDLDLGRKQAADLPAEVEKLLLHEDITLSQLTHIGVTVGPGYFTGLRIGMAYASALAMALDINVIPLSSLEAVLYAIPEYAAGVKVPLIAASRERVFSAAWREGIPFLSERERSREELMSDLGDTAEQAELWAVDDARLFATGSRGGVHFLSSPSGAAIAELAAERVENSIKPDSLRARYLREPGLGRSL